MWRHVLKMMHLVLKIIFWMWMGCHVHVVPLHVHIYVPCVCTTVLSCCLHGACELLSTSKQKCIMYTLLLKVTKFCRYCTQDDAWMWWHMQVALLFMFFLASAQLAYCAVRWCLQASFKGIETAVAAVATVVPLFRPGSASHAGSHDCVIMVQKDVIPC